MTKNAENSNTKNPFEMFKNLPFMDGKMPHMGNMPNMECLKNNNMMNDMGRRCTKAVSTANDSTQAIMRRQMEMMQDSAKNTAEMVKHCSSAGNAESFMETQVHWVRDVVEHQMNNARELAEMAMKSGMEVFDLCRESVVETINDGMKMSSQCSKKKA